MKSTLNYGRIGSESQAAKKPATQDRLEAISFGRFSSKPQELGDSRRRQEESYKTVLARYPNRLAESQRYGFGKIFLEGRSAFHGEGEHLDVLLDLIREGEIKPGKSCIVIDAWSRFSRIVPDIAVTKLSQIVRSGVPLVVASPDMFVDDGTIGGPQFIMISACLQMAYSESLEKSRFQKSVRARIRETGLTKNKIVPATCPFWLSVVDGKYVENEYAELVREMFRLHLAGYGCQEISNELGNPTRTLKHKGRKVKIDVLGVLRNRAVIGEWIQQERIGKNKRKAVGVKEHYYPCILQDPNIFFQVQQSLDAKGKEFKGRGRKGPGCTNLFTSIMRGDDGLPMHIKNESSGRKTLRRKTKGVLRTWDYAEIETALLRFMRELKLTGVAVSNVDHTAELTDCEKNIAKNETLMETCPSEAIGRVLQRLEAKKKALILEIEKEKARQPETTTLEQTQSMLQMLAACKPADRLDLRTRLRGAIARLVSRIDVSYRINEDKIRYVSMVVTLGNGEKRSILLFNKGQTHYEYAYDKDGAEMYDCGGTHRPDWLVVMREAS